MAETLSIRLKQLLCDNLTKLKRYDENNYNSRTDERNSYRSGCTIQPGRLQQGREEAEKPCRGIGRLPKGTVWKGRHFSDSSMTSLPRLTLQSSNVYENSGVLVREIFALQRNLLQMRLVTTGF